MNQPKRDPVLHRLNQLDGALPDPEVSPQLAMAIFENSADAMVIVNMYTGNIRYVNKMAELVFGYHRSELVGNLVEMLIPEEKRTQHQKDVQVFAKEPRARPMHGGRLLEGRHKSGSEILASVMLSPVSVPEGQFVVATIRPHTGTLTATRLGHGSSAG